jgi:hypothetical protein
LVNTEFIVERDHGPPAEGAASFHTTRWTIVMRAAQNQTLGGHSALAELCGLYWYPLYMFARRRGHSPDDAHQLRKRCTALFRDEVGRTVPDAAEIHEQIRTLCEALIASEGWLGP